ncbi:hypothetical protein A9490_28005 [Bacillus thuringiensis]|uniref:hypothetical protein n=1 Tax=Bacillus thuringiensis TaxID=1428 RepID=UPI0008FDC523|nr:hypothetical protein [Bacillus thuringiensis]OJE28365.1 hypothetical protein A9490_28005 [Bacillus thuringiensis]
MRNTNLKFDSALIIFLISFAGYGIVTLFEMGYKHHYGLPSNFIELNVNTLGRALVTVLIFILIGVGGQLFIQKAEKNKGIGTKFVYKDADNKMRLTKKSIVFFWLCTLIFLIVFFFDKRSLWALNIWILISLTTFLILKDKIIPAVVSLVLLFMACSYSLGGYQASQKTEYLFLKNKDWAVIDYYKDYAILAKVDMKNREFYPEYQFIKLESTKTNEQQFELKQTGFMKMNK